MKRITLICVVVFSFFLFSCAQKTASTLFLTTTDENIYSIDLASGKCNWQNVKNNKDSRSDSYFALGEKMLIKTYENGQIIAFDKTSGTATNLYKDLDVSDKNPALCMFSQYPIIQNDEIIYANLNGKIRSINLNTKQQNWVYDAKTNVYVSPVMVGNNLIVNTGYYLIALNAKTGQWISQLKFVKPLPLEPIVSDSKIFVVDETGNAFCLNEKLELIWQFEVANNISGSYYDEARKTNVSTDIHISINTNLVAGKKLIVFGDEKNIICIDKSTGNMKWSGEIPTLNLNSPEGIAVISKIDRANLNMDSLLNYTGKLKSLQIINDEVIANTSSCIVAYDSKDGIVKKEKRFSARKIVGGIKAYNDFYYYLCDDGVLYKLDKALEKEDVVYKGISFKSTEDEYSGTYIVIE